MVLRRWSHISVGKLRGLGSFTPLCSVVDKHSPCLAQTWATLLLCCSPCLSAAGTVPAEPHGAREEGIRKLWLTFAIQTTNTVINYPTGPVLSPSPQSPWMMGDNSVGVKGQSSHCSHGRWGCTEPRTLWGSLWEQLRAVQAPGAPGALKKQLLCAAGGRSLLTGSVAAQQDHSWWFCSWAARTWALLFPSAQHKGLELPLHKRNKHKARGLHKAGLAAWKNRNQDLDKSKRKLKLCRN